ncbi:hypothetical protein ACFWZP_12380, partial [Streptomyces sp. NPDC059013]
MSEPVKGSAGGSEPAGGSVRELDQSASAAAYRPLPAAEDDGGARGVWSRRRITPPLLAGGGAGAGGLVLLDVV